MPDDLADYVPENAHHDGHRAKSNEGISKIIDVKLPLAWLISSLVVVSLSFGGLYMQVNNVALQLTTMETNSLARDQQMTLILQDLAAVKTNSVNHQNEIIQDEAQITTINSEIVDIDKNARFMPK